MKYGIPSKIPEMEVSIRFGKSKKGTWGHWDPKKREILLSTTCNRFQAHTTFIHEMLHCIDDLTIAQGFKHKRLPHGWIIGNSANILLFLVLSGLYKGLAKKPLLKFYKDLVMRQMRQNRKKKHG